MFYREGLFSLRPTSNLEDPVLSELSPGTCPARLNLPGTAFPADIDFRVTKTRKPPHHDKVQHLGRALCATEREEDR